MNLQEVPGWIQPANSVGSSSTNSISSTTPSMNSVGSYSLPSPTQEHLSELDLTCSEALEESVVSYLI